VEGGVAPVLALNDQSLKEVKGGAGAVE